MTISRSKDAPTRYKVVVGGWTLIVRRSSLFRAIEAVVVILASAALFFVGQAHALRDYLADQEEIRHQQAIQSWERYERMRDGTSDKIFLPSRVELERTTPRARYKIQTPIPKKDMSREEDWV